MTDSLLEDKLITYRNQIREIMMHESVKVSELRNITGRLQFPTVVILVGRPFLWRLIELLSPSDKSYWHKKLQQGAQEDLNMWLGFLHTHNGTTIISQPSTIMS